MQLVLDKNGNKGKRLSHKFISFSDKQKLACSWWSKSEYKNCSGIICDGSVRSGKTLAQSFGFVSYAMSLFNAKNFAFCGKTITSLKRNVTDELLTVLRRYGFYCNESKTKNYIDIKVAGRTNRFYIFGGKDEGSSALIQGITLAGVLFDEVVLMPRTFVEQAIARCSVTGSKLWFNCNPDNPHHWFYTDYIKKCDEKKLLYLHFTMNDNPSLSAEVRARYEGMFRGHFYDRFVRGLWTVSSGVVYPQEIVQVADEIPECTKHVISCDYGTVNPSSFGLWGCGIDGVWYRKKEYYYDSRKTGMSRTDEEHFAALCELADGYKIDKVIVDPSAASFIECIKRHGEFDVTRADNDVLTGIRRTADALKNGKIKIYSSCKDILREFALYTWKENSVFDVPIKENDHAMDDMRYFVMSELSENTADVFFVLSASR